eukprot:GEZU01014859.1.p3 GENE.GEZU01014859.1~~GEZU01014859.1.p3  ORF type:complete len:103 (-),score=25.19 GEZU01014859.1:67-375(-)
MPYDKLFETKKKAKAKRNGINSKVMTNMTWRVISTQRLVSHPQTAKKFENFRLISWNCFSFQSTRIILKHLAKKIENTKLTSSSMPTKETTKKERKKVGFWI